jgi:hypothetical protein
VLIVFALSLLLNYNKSFEIFSAARLSFRVSHFDNYQNVAWFDAKTTEIQQKQKV